ncbi:MAG: glycosyltransferase family 10 [Pseudomonadota bacterium]
MKKAGNKQVLLVVNFSFQTFAGSDKDFIKHLPGRIPTWMDFDFEITDSLPKRKKSEYDFVIFYGENHWLHHECQMPYQPFSFINDLYRIKYKKVLYLGTEGRMVVDYNEVYRRLFQEWPYCDFNVFVVQNDFKYARPHQVSHLAGTWHSFVYDDEDQLDYDFFNRTSPEKTKTLAIVASNASYASGHRDRIDFAHKIKDLFKDKIDFYGRGFNEFRNKYYTLSPYKYTIEMENGVQENYWTDKLIDAYLMESYPIYYGCPNINDYFNEEAMTKIDINDFASAAKTIEKVIDGNFYEKKYDRIKEAKDLILNKYNFFNVLRDYCLRLEKVDD